MEVCLEGIERNRLVNFARPKVAVQGAVMAVQLIGVSGSNDINKTKIIVNSDFFIFIF